MAGGKPRRARGVGFVARVVTTGAVLGAVATGATGLRAGAGPVNRKVVQVDRTAPARISMRHWAAWDLIVPLRVFVGAGAGDGPPSASPSSPDAPPSSDPSVPSDPTTTAATTSPSTTTTTTTAAPSGLAELAAAVSAVVPDWARSAVQPRYSIGDGGCGDGCTWAGDPPSTRFSPWVLTQSFAFVEAAIAHEYAHALGFSHLAAYRYSDWSNAPEEWARQFHQLDAGIRVSDDREAFAACLARAWTGFDWAPNQVRAECPLTLATWVDQQAEVEVSGSDGGAAG